MDRDRELRLLARRARAAALRLRVNATLARLAEWLPLPLSLGAVALAVIKVVEPSNAIEQLFTWLARGSAVLVVGIIAREAFSARPKRLGALALDRHHGLADRVTSALELSTVPASERTPLMDAAISDGAARARRLDPRRAVPLRMPHAFFTSGVLGLIVVLLTEVELKRVVPPPPPPAEVAAVLIDGDDLDLLRQMKEPVDSPSGDPELAAAARRFNQLIEDIGANRVDRHQVFSQIEAIDRELLQVNVGREATLEAGLKGLASELEKSDLSKPLAAALTERNLADAEQALRELSTKLKNKRDVNREQLEQLRRALAAAAQKSSEGLARVAAERQQVEAEQERLLKKKTAGAPLTQAEAQQLEQQGRRLDRLNGEHDPGAEHELSDLDRELAEAARKLLEEMPASAERLEQAAADLNRMEGEQMSRAEKEALKQRLEELRALLREQGNGNEQRREQMQRFARRARGEEETPRGAPQRDPKRLSFDANGGGVSLAAPQVPKAGGASEHPSSEAPQSGASQWGNGSDASLRGEKSDVNGKLQDVSAAGIDTGQGPSVSSVVYGAAERGFAGHGYRKVYTDYRTVAEDAIAHDQIPPGYSFYVRRYFQLIRPRD